MLVRRLKLLLRQLSSISKPIIFTRKVAKVTDGLPNGEVEEEGEEMFDHLSCEEVVMDIPARLPGGQVEEGEEEAKEMLYHVPYGIDRLPKGQVEEEAAKVTFDHLPHEVVIEILVRLPVKSLMRCRCVSKNWYSLISGTTFINTHTNRALAPSDDNDKNNFVLFRYEETVSYSIEMKRCFQLFSLRFDDASFGNNENFIELDPPFKAHLLSTPPSIVGSCNGLICMCDALAYSEEYMVWNPSIRRVLTLPKPNFRFSTHEIHQESHGFGYDHLTNDFKLVRLVYLEGQHNKVLPLVELYSLNSGFWREIAAPGSSYLIEEPCLSVFVNGTSHWIAQTSPDKGTFRNVILAFDMGDEVFREIVVPNCFIGKKRLNMNVAVLHGLLLLVPYNERREELSSSVWIMKQYGVGESWTQLFDIHMNPGLRRVVGLRKHGEVLVTDIHGELLSYEPDTQQITHLGFRGYPILEEDDADYPEEAFYWEKYPESLVLLNVKDEVPEGLANASSVCSTETTSERKGMMHCLLGLSSMWKRRKTKTSAVR